MELTILGSSSDGNAYVLQNEDEALLLEAGMPWSEIRKVLDWNTLKIRGCLITHEHGDHARHVHELLKDGQDIYCSHDTADNLRYRDSRRPHIIRAGEELRLGGFRILPFATRHDAAEPLGFYINHPETGNILFATDTYYLPHTFLDLNHVMIECNYSLPILKDNIAKGLVPPAVARRTLESHMSLENCIRTLQANDLTKVRRIILLHLSPNNSDPGRFRMSIQQETHHPTIVALPWLTVNMNKTPF